MKKNIVFLFFLVIISSKIFSEDFWIDELKKNTFFNEEQIFIHKKYSNTTYEYFQSIFDHAFEISDKKFYSEEELIKLKIGQDIKLDTKTGYTYCKIKDDRYFIVVGDNYPFMFKENSQAEPIVTTQENLHLKRSTFEGSPSSYTFDIKKINTSSFLTEKTKNGEWKYDGKDIERFPILIDENSNGDTCKYIPMPWVEGKDGDGIGEWIEFETSPIKTLFIVNGFVDVRRPYLYKQNNRLQTATLICTPKNETKEAFEMKLEFQDFVYTKTIELPDNCVKFKLVIDSVYKGSRYSDTVITSIYTKKTKDSI